MTQTPLPANDSILIDLPLPSGFEAWRDLYLQSVVEKLVVFAICALLLYLVSRVVRQVVLANIEDINRRHALRKWVMYGYVSLLLLVAIALFANWLAGLGTILALLVAGIAVALQDVLKSVVGWLYLSGRAGIEIGSRIEVGGIIGDVIDIGVLKTTMLEVGGTLVYGRQSTGRLVTVPNYRMLSESVMIAPASAPYVWQEMRINVTFESDWRRAEAILKEVGDEIHRKIDAQVERGFRALERRYAFKHGKLTPIVYVTIGPSGVELTLRFIVDVRGRRGMVDLASRRVLDALAADDSVKVAYTTYRLIGVDGNHSAD